jgi:glycosyltransferase involved in cell wall biosynthesis
MRGLTRRHVLLRRRLHASPPSIESAVREAWCVVLPSSYIRRSLPANIVSPHHMPRYRQNQPAVVPGISVAISAHNEEAVLRGCLESAKDWAREIIVVDSGSSDRTRAIAREYTDRVFASDDRLMLNANKNRAIEAGTCEWILVLDPDERVSCDLARELLAIAKLGADGPDAYWIARRTYEFGRWVQTMGLYPDHQLRFFRNGRGRFPCRDLHETVEVRGSTGYLTSELVHRPPFGTAKAVYKQNLYSEHHARVLNDRGELFRVYRLLLRPLRAFLRTYVLRSGWREGLVGWIVSMRTAYTSFLVNVKLWELQQLPPDQLEDRSNWALSSSLPAQDALAGADSKRQARGRKPDPHEGETD